jgi:GntR family transcriptional regulator / MocR family aminotransferase
LEQALAELFHEGVIKRHLRKALNAYHERRDVLANQLRQKLSNRVSFEVPAGGLAIWVKFKKPVDLKRLSISAAKHGLILNDGTNYNPPNANLNSTRVGFASLNPKEIEKGVSVLEQCIEGTKE